MRALVLATIALAGLSLPAFAQDMSQDPRESFTISDDLSALPAPVAKMRQALIEAAKTGDIEALRPLVEAQANPPTVSFGGPDDPVLYLKENSADGEGLQNLAILAELLDAPYGVMTSEAGEDPIYIWPYLAGMWDVTKLTPAQKVDALQLISPEALGELAQLEAWYYWRVLIGSDGEWLAFVAGD